MTNSESSQPIERQKPPLLTLERSVFTSILLLLYSDVFSGVIRYSFNALGITYLAYLPMVFSVAVVIVAILSGGLESEFALRLYVTAIAFFLWGIYSVCVGRALESVLFSLYTWTPFFIGALIIKSKLFYKLLPHVYFLLAASIIGLLINSAVHVPWIDGSTFTVGGLEVSATTTWDSYGVDRLPGFSRASFTAANDILLFLLWLLSSNIKLALKVAAWACSVYAIVLTTSKTPLAIAVSAPIVLLVYQWLNRLSYPRKSLSANVYSFSVLLALLVGVIVPPIIRDRLLGLGYTRFAIEDYLPFMRMGSFTDRVVEMWPRAFNLIQLDNNAAETFLGRGLGGIGVGQQLTEQNLYNSADNLNVFLWVTFGLFSAVFYSILIIGHRNALFGRDLPPNTYFATMLGILGLGTLTSVIEGTVPCMGLGIIFAACIAPQTVGGVSRIAERIPSMNRNQCLQNTQANE